MGHDFGCGDGSCFDWHQRHVVCEFSSLCSLGVLSTGFRRCGGHCVLGSRFGPALAVCFFFFSLFELNRILAVVFGRTHFGSQVEFCGLCSSLTCTPSALVRDSRAMIEPYILG